MISIDLGTNNSYASKKEAGICTITASAKGFRTSPSVVAYTKTQDLLVGQIAKCQAVINLDNTFGAVKHLIGKRSNEVNGETNNMPYTVDSKRTKDKINSAWIDKSYSPEEISTSVLRKLANDATEYLRQTVTQAVVTVPAYFNDSQRQATKDASKIAGLEIPRMMNEPTAAALANELDKKSAATILIIDLGGRRREVSIVEVGDGVFEVISICGDAHLGDDNFNKTLVDCMAATFEKKEDIDLRHGTQPFRNSRKQDKKQGLNSTHPCKMK